MQWFLKHLFDVKIEFVEGIVAELSVDLLIRCKLIFLF